MVALKYHAMGHTRDCVDPADIIIYKGHTSGFSPGRRSMSPSKRPADSSRFTIASSVDS